MSAFVDCETIIQDGECLIQALGEVGFPQHNLVIQYELDAEGNKVLDEKGQPIMLLQRLHGYRGDLRQDQAHIVIPKRFVGGWSNDIGFRREADGTWRAIISEYDRARFNDAWLTRLTDEYSAKVIEKDLTRRRRPYRKERVNGEIVITAITGR